jgi:hypothetical protein
MVLTIGVSLVDLGSYKSGYTLDLRLAQNPTRVFDGTAAHIERYTITGTVHIPEPEHVRAEMFLGLLGQEWSSDCAFLDERLDTIVFRHKEKSLGVHQQHTHFLASFNHLAGFLEGDA